MSDLILPEEATAEILEVLGKMNFQTCPIAHVYRRAGHEIPRKVEDEQAFVLFRLLKFVLKHGPDWREEFGKELDETVEIAKEKEANNESTA